jgi:hypothetical protein
MLAAPQMLATLEMLLPLIRKESQEYAAAAIFTSEPNLTRDCANAWFEAVSHVECAIKSAKHAAPHGRRLGLIGQQAKHERPQRAQQIGERNAAQASQA